MPFVSSTYGTGNWGVFGKSSGGYGSIILGMRHPDVFKALADHSGDANFELCYIPDASEALDQFREAGGLRAWLDKFWTDDNRHRKKWQKALNFLAMSAHYSPNPDSPHLGIDLPFALDSGEFRWDVWQRWMEWDPVRLVERYADNLRKLRLIYVDCGSKDEFALHWGARALKRFSDSPCTAWARRGTSACTNAGGPMQAYSMDLRERALLDSDAGMKAADVAVKYRVSGSWVRLLKQRRRETGEVAPRVQRHGRRRMLEPHLHTLAALIAEQPDRTLAELKDALGTPARLATIWRAVAALDVTVKKNGPALRTRST